MRIYRAICDRCGFEYPSSELRRMWNGLMVCSEDFEKRNAQEFVRAPKPDKSPYGAKEFGEMTFLTTNQVTADDL